MGSSDLMVPRCPSITHCVPTRAPRHAKNDFSEGTELFVKKARFSSHTLGLAPSLSSWSSLSPLHGTPVGPATASTAGSSGSSALRGRAAGAAAWMSSRADSYSGPHLKLSAFWVTCLISWSDAFSCSSYFLLSTTTLDACRAFFFVLGTASCRSH